MVSLPEKIENLVTQYTRLPGIGEKTALRQVMAMLKWEKESLRVFSQAGQELGEIKYCQHCGMFSEEDICNICSSSNRQESKIICVIESVVDLMAIENSNRFTGLYHILGGVLNPLAGIGPDQLRIEQLIKQISRYEIEEVILAVNPSVEGDATCSYIKQLLPDHVKVERIGFGIPIGGSLEYLDPLTISKALENRRML